MHQVVLQNGMGAADEIAALPAVAGAGAALLVGSTTNGSYLLPGALRVAHAGRGQTWLGRVGGGALGAEAAAALRELRAVEGMGVAALELQVGLRPPGGRWR